MKESYIFIRRNLFFSKDLKIFEQVIDKTYKMYNSLINIK